MAQEEKFGTRDQSYSAWHRRNSTRRFVGIEKAQTLAMIDLDACPYVEYDDRSKEPIALIEVAMDIGQSWKTHTVTKNLARLCTERSLPAYVVLYKKSSEDNPADRSQKDIEAFRVIRIWPNPESQWRILTPEQWAIELVEMRRQSAENVDRVLNQELLF